MLATTMPSPRTPSWSHTCGALTRSMFHSTASARAFSRLPSAGLGRSTLSSASIRATSGRCARAPASFSLPTTRTAFTIQYEVYSAPAPSTALTTPAWLRAAWSFLVRRTDSALAARVCCFPAAVRSAALSRYTQKTALAEPSSWARSLGSILRSAAAGAVGPGSCAAAATPAPSGRSRTDVRAASAARKDRAGLDDLVGRKAREDRLLRWATCCLLVRRVRVVREGCA